MVLEIKDLSSSHSNATKNNNVPSGASDEDWFCKEENAPGLNISVNQLKGRKGVCAGCHLGTAIYNCLNPQEPVDSVLE